MDHLVVEDDFLPEVGFLRHDNFRRTFTSARFSPRPQSIRSVRQFSLEGSFDTILTADENHLETRQAIAAFQTKFESSDRLTFTATDSYELLAEPFVPPGAGFSIPPGGYRFADVQVAYSIGQQRRLNGSMAVRRGALLRGRPDHGGADTGSHCGAAPDVGGAQRLLQLDRHALRGVPDEPGGDAGKLTPSARACSSAGSCSTTRPATRLAATCDCGGSTARASELFVVYTDDHDVAGGLRPDRGWDLRNRGLVVKFNKLFRF